MTKKVYTATLEYIGQVDRLGRDGAKSGTSAKESYTSAQNKHERFFPNVLFQAQMFTHGNNKKEHAQKRPLVSDCVHWFSVIRETHARMF